MTDEAQEAWEEARKAWLRVVLAFDVDPEVAFGRTYPLAKWQRRPWFWKKFWLRRRYAR